MCTRSIHICLINEQINENPKELPKTPRYEKLYTRVKTIIQQSNSAVKKISEESKSTQADKESIHLMCISSTRLSLPSFTPVFFKKASGMPIVSLHNLKNVKC